VNLVLISAVLVAAAWAAPPNRQLQELVDSGALSDLRWPNFTRVQADVTRFYDLNDYQPVWTRNGDATPQAQALIGVLENAALKGLDAEDYDGSRWNSRLSHLRTDAEANRFDLALTISAMRYISDVSSGKVDPKVFSFGLHFDIKNCDLGETIRKLVSSSDVAADLDRVEPPFEGYWRTQKALAHYLELSREATLTQRNTSLAKQVRKLQLVLERWRWAPHSFPRPPIVVNIPEFKLRAYDDRYRPELEMKVVVGKAYRHKTPVFSGSITHLIFRPYWDVPLSIQRAELVPKVAKDPAYLAKNDYEVVNVERQVVSSSSVSADMLAQLRSGKLLIRQIPGDKNALGPVKFLFPNEYNVYLHGTPAKSLFLKSRRDFSHGCIRVEKPEELAQWVLRDLPGWDMDHIREAENGADSHRVNLDKPIPVLIVYGTAVVREDGEVSFYDDIYGHDAELERLLDHGYPYSGWQPTSAARDPHPRE
jgi:murein L,D-transpeptidase YcbB/YkuD